MVFKTISIKDIFSATYHRLEPAFYLSQSEILENYDKKDISVLSDICELLIIEETQNEMLPAYSIASKELRYEGNGYYKSSGLIVDRPCIIFQKKTDGGIRFLHYRENSRIKVLGAVAVVVPKNGIDALDLCIMLYHASKTFHHVNITQANFNDYHHIIKIPNKIDQEFKELWIGYYAAQDMARELSQKIEEWTNKEKKT